MFELLVGFIDYFGLCDDKGRNNKTTNQLDYEYERKKNFADKYVEAEIAIANEKDPVKKRKMSMRLALNVTDFSDL